MDIKPNWDLIAKEIDSNESAEKQNEFWINKCKEWLSCISKNYGNNYQFSETDNFIILSDENDRYNELFSEFLERTLKRILLTLPDLASDEGYGKHAVIIFKEIDQYYNYVSYFNNLDEAQGLSSGMYINDGYGHFVFPTHEIDFAEPLAAHELTHACLSNLPIPLWLNEGLAVSMESVITNIHLNLNNELVAKHADYWNEDTIQNFWTGESFRAIDEGQQLSYSLANILVQNISTEYEVFKKFALEANFNDTGNAASQKYFNTSIGNVAAIFLGDGDWQPKENLFKNNEQ